MSAYHNSNLLYRPSVSIWTARIKDKAQSIEVHKSNGAVAGAANVYKQLLPESPELKAIQQHAAAFRTWIYDSTLPWDDSGWRIGRVARHMDFMDQAGDWMRQFDEKVQAFAAVYTQAFENARFTLNNLFDEADYPGVNEVISKFGITLDVTSLPNTEDFRVVDGIPSDEVERLVQIAKTSVDERVKAAMGEAFSRLHGVVSKMAETLVAYENKAVKKFNDSLVGNIAALVDVMPALNILDDADLNDYTATAKLLCDYAPEDLRKDAKTRKAAIAEAQALSRRMKPTENNAPPAVHTPADSSMANKLRDLMSEES